MSKLCGQTMLTAAEEVKNMGSVYVNVSIVFQLGNSDGAMW